MSTLTPDLSPSAQWLADMPASYRKIAGHIEAIAREMDVRHQQFWAMSDDQINLTWTTLGRGATETVFGMHALSAQYVNQALDVLRANGFSSSPGCRADRPRDYVINTAGNLEIVPLPLPPVEPITFERAATGYPIDDPNYIPLAPDPALEGFAIEPPPPFEEVPSTPEPEIQPVEP